MLAPHEMEKTQSAKFELSQNLEKGEGLRESTLIFEDDTEKNLEKNLMEKNNIITEINEEVEMVKYNTAQDTDNVNGSERSTNSLTFNNTEHIFIMSDEEEQIKMPYNSFEVSKVLQPQDNPNTLNEFLIANRSFANNELQKTNENIFKLHGNRRSYELSKQKSNDEQFYEGIKREELWQENLESWEEMPLHNTTLNAPNRINSLLESRKEELASTTYRQHLNNENVFSGEAQNGERSHKNKNTLRCFRSSSEAKTDILQDKVILQPSLLKSKRNASAEVISNTNEGEVVMFAAKNALPISRKKIVKPLFSETSYVGLTKISVPRLSAQKPYIAKQSFSFNNHNKHDVKQAAMQTRLRNLVTTYQSKEKKLDWHAIKQVGLRKETREKHTVIYDDNSSYNNGNNNNKNNNKDIDINNKSINKISYPKKDILLSKENDLEYKAKFLKERENNSMPQSLKLHTNNENVERKFKNEQFKVQKFYSPTQQSSVPISTTQYITDIIADANTTAPNYVKTETHPLERGDNTEEIECVVAMKSNGKCMPSELSVETKLVDMESENNLLRKRIQISSISCSTSAESISNTLKQKSACDNKEVNTSKENRAKLPITIKVSRVNNSNSHSITNRKMNNFGDKLSKSIILNENVISNVTSHDINSLNESSTSTSATPVYATRKIDRH